MKIERICESCKTSFFVEKREVNRNGGRYCSTKCFNNIRKGIKKILHTNVKCALCGTEFYKSDSKRKKSISGLFFCSRKCKDKAQRIDGIKELHLPHYGRGKGKYTYRRTAFENNDIQCNRCGYSDHKEILEVHHIDRNRSNNKPENLEILCPNCHMIDHFQQNDGRYTKMHKKGVTCSKTGEEVLQTSCEEFDSL